MAVVIRLARTGAKHTPKYRITVADSRRYATGKHLEVIGTYVPTPKGNDQKLKIDLEKYNEWVKKGAQPTDRVKHVVKLAQATK
ncbi:MAG: 30S ribosomal protein S16 [Bdellovibrionaceae bacterium]|nr:30S ribosomal protein S16 [Pseudobdellovibrionaceae bacterium]